MERMDEGSPAKKNVWSADVNGRILSKQRFGLIEGVITVLKVSGLSIEAARELTIKLTRRVVKK
jgi:hypothetical protein